MTRHTNSVIIIAIASKVTGTTFKSPKFTGSFDSAADLYEQAGDSYVSTSTWGGQHIASYQFLATDKESAQWVKNTAETSLSGAGVNLSAQLSTAVTNVVKNTNVAYDFNQKGIGFANGELPTPVKVTDLVLAFGNKVLDNPAIINFSTHPYSRVAKHP